MGSSIAQTFVEPRISVVPDESLEVGTVQAGLEVTIDVSLEVGKPPIQRY